MYSRRVFKFEQTQNRRIHTCQREVRVAALYRSSLAGSRVCLLELAPALGLKTMKSSRIYQTTKLWLVHLVHEHVQR